VSDVRWLPFTVFIGLLTLAWCLYALAAWLRLRHAIAGERSSKRRDFYTRLFICALLICTFGFSFVFPTCRCPMAFLLTLWGAISELRIAFRA
jgi:hypothetical protein